MGWGTCWHTYRAVDSTAIAPIPLNIILHYARNLWLWASVGRWGNLSDRILSEAVQYGHTQGYKDAVNAIHAFVLDETLNRDLEKFKREKGLE